MCQDELAVLDEKCESSVIGLSSHFEHHRLSDVALCARARRAADMRDVEQAKIGYRSLVRQHLGRHRRLS